VALARAVVARPRILLLDEPLSGLDPALREDVRRAILAVQSEYGPAMVLVTHDLEEAGRSANRVAVLLEGGVAQIGSPEAVFRHPASASLARFLGFPNEVPGVRDSHGLRLAGWAVESEPGGEGNMASDSGRVVVLFGTDGGHLAPPTTPGIPASVTAVLHDPRGITARVEIRVSGAPTGSDSPRTLSLELAVTAERTPHVGQELSLVVDPQRLHVFAADAPSQDGGAT
jgi:ABC-type sulfate/molybdate transport systems ATPase subunit